MSQVTSTPGALSDSLLIRNLPADDYHADKEAASCSMLKPILESPAHFMNALLAHQSSTSAMDFGTLIHCLVLEPGKLHDQYAVYPGVMNGHDPEVKKFKAANAQKIIIEEAELAVAQAVATKTIERKFRGRPFGDYVSEGIPEATIYFTDPATGMRCRVRFDLLHPEINFDLKTTRHIGVQQFSRDIASMNYDLQAYMYSLACALYDGAAASKPFVFVPVENTAPWSVSMLQAGESVLSSGCRKYERAMASYASCMQTNHWPDAGVEEIVELEHWNVYSGAEPQWRRQLAADASESGLAS